VRFALIGFVLLILAAVGVAHVVNPDRFIARSGVRKGGELLTAWNRLGFRVVGAIFAGFALYLLYQLTLDYFGGGR
jgi:hypothetical protein